VGQLPDTRVHSTEPEKFGVFFLSLLVIVWLTWLAKYKNDSPHGDIMISTPQLASLLGNTEHLGLKERNSNVALSDKKSRGRQEQDLIMYSKKE